VVGSEPSLLIYRSPEVVRFTIVMSSMVEKEAARVLPGPLNEMQH
jgi:hypothetical protein